MWFRRDLRLSDNLALLNAARAAGDHDVVALFCIDPPLHRAARAPRVAFLYRAWGKIHSQEYSEDTQRVSTFDAAEGVRTAPDVVPKPLP